MFQIADVRQGLGARRAEEAQRADRLRDLMEQLQTLEADLKTIDTTDVQVRGAGTDTGGGPQDNRYNRRPGACMCALCVTDSGTF